MITCAKRCASEKVGGCVDRNCRDNCALRSVPANGYLQFDEKLAQELHAYEERDEVTGQVFRRPMPLEHNEPMCIYHYGRWLDSWAGVDLEDEEDKASARWRCFKWVPIASTHSPDQQ
jgi:hypothetical protein